MLILAFEVIMHPLVPKFAIVHTFSNFRALCNRSMLMKPKKYYLKSSDYLQIRLGTDHILVTTYSSRKGSSKNNSGWFCCSRRV